MPPVTQLGQSELTHGAGTRGCSPAELSFVHPAAHTRAAFHKASKDLSSCLTTAETNVQCAGCRQPQCLPGGICYEEMPGAWNRWKEISRSKNSNTKIAFYSAHPMDREVRL